MAVWIDIDNRGEIQNYKFIRGIMKSHARLTYEQVQSAYNGEITHDTISPVMPQIQTLTKHIILSKPKKTKYFGIGHSRKPSLYGRNGQCGKN